MPRWIWIAAVGVVACVGADTVDKPGPMIAVDQLLTLDTFIGGSPVLTGTVNACDGPLPLTVYGNKIELLHLEEVEVYIIRVLGLENEARSIFRFILPFDLLPVSSFGLPVEITIELETVCLGQRVRSPPFPITYIPTESSIVPAFNPKRFWPDLVPGDVITCSGLVLQQYILATELAAEVNLGFLCTIGEMTGAPDERRYLTNEGGGVAAVDPGFDVPWAVPYNLTDARVDATGDPIIIFKRGLAGQQQQQLVVLDRDTGDETFTPIDIDKAPRGKPFRNASGELLVLEVEAGDNTRTYFVHRYDAFGGDLGEVQVMHYDWLARSYPADFDPTGRYLYVTAAPVNEANRVLAKVDLEDCPEDVCTTVWETPANEPWYISYGEYETRVLSASDGGFIWLDAATGEALTDLFGPASGNSFLRAAIEADGSIAMIADPNGAIAQGLYLFDPQGNSTMRFHSGNALFRWLTPAWGDGVMISFFEELHLLYSRSDYDALLAEPAL